MSGLFGGGDDDPPAPTRSPKGVKIVRSAPSSRDSILARGAIAANAGAPAGSTLLDDEERRGALGTFGGGY